MELAKRNGIERRYNTFYIKGIALVQCNEVSINITVADSHLHMFYDPVTNRYFAFSMPFFFEYVNAPQLFSEGIKLCSQLEEMPFSAPSVPSKQADSELDRIITSLSVLSDRTLPKGAEYRRAKDYVKLRYPECYEIVRYLGVKKDTVKFMESIFARQWEIAENLLILLSMDCENPKCVDRIGKFIEQCSKIIRNKEVRQ